MFKSMTLSQTEAQKALTFWLKEVVLSKEANNLKVSRVQWNSQMSSIELTIEPDQEKKDD